MALQTIYITNHQNPNVDLLANLMVAADAGLTDWWVNTGNELVVVNNAGGTAITITDQLPVLPGGAFDGLQPTARNRSLAAGKWIILGPYPQSYNNATGQMTLAWSAVASVKLLVFLKGS